MLEEALEIATDSNYRFDLAVQLGRVDDAKAQWIILFFTFPRSFLLYSNVLNSCFAGNCS